ncbi:F-box protein CPR1-like [Daucus carota subsp. sativus]|uniref:F-box protein CPR1-like n=1 Tax=Daucus carota subsp. sativus TaxID=79200 RepID=UPI0007F015FF|nr:PREDICTED: F-box protein CPR30-like [Daucus carota subsp. sativus]
MARRENCKKNNSELPHELMFNIFFLLPVATLLRCKSVCKTWLSIISDPRFVKAHCIESQKRQPSSVLEVASDQLCIDNHETKTLFERPEYLYGMSHFISCCNGLVCLANHDSHIIYLGNPSTRQFKKLPTPPKKTDLRYWFMVGFGFDDVSGDYKIIRIVCKCKHISYNIEAEMYSAKEDSWKKIKVPEGLEKFKFPRFRGVGVFLPDQTRVLYFEGFYELLSFDLHDEVFRVHPFPKPGKLLSLGKPIKSSLLEFEGYVGIIYEESSGDGETVPSLWTLDGDFGNGSWTKQFNFEDHIKNDHVTLYLGDGQFVVAAESYNYSLQSIFYYHRKNQSKEYLGASPARELTSVVKYNESLVSLKGFKQLE